MLLAQNALGKGTGPDEFILKRKDGTQVTVEIRTQPVRVEGHTLVLGIARDITERKNIEEALRASEEKYRILHEFAGEAIFTFFLDLKLMEINKAACEYIGFSREELLGENVFDLGILHPDDMGRAAENTSKILSKEKHLVVDKLRFKGKHGLYGTFQVTSTPVIRNGEIVAITNVCRDITNEERLYSALEASERKYRFLFNAGNDAIFVYGLTEDKKPANFIEVNDLTCMMTGYSREELHGLTPLDIVPPSERQKVYESNRILREMKHRLFERTIVAKEGRTIPCEISSHFFELNGVPTVLAIARDITERKRMEGNLKATLKEKDILLREIHHRVRNNLQIMSSLLRLHARQISDEKAQEAFQESQTRIRSIAMIHENLYQSRDFASVDFADYIQKVVTHLVVVYKVDPRRVLFKEEVRTVDLDVSRAIPCGLIVNELISNSLKYAFPGGKKGEVTVKMFEDEAGRFHLIVRDTGVGFPEDVDIEKPQTLGFQIVSDLTKQLEGRIELRRKDGTEFEITF
jgi:PAS domain S-box-containing protein